MRVDIFTLFPAMLTGYLQESILKRAQEAGQLTVALHDIRDYTADKHHVTDDLPYGGGGGMVLKPEPIFSAVEAIFQIPNPKSQIPTPQSPIPIILLTPQGRVFNQKIARELAGYERLALICGRYEGVDERVCEHLVTDEISIGDFVLTGGELPALIVVDAVARLLPGVLGDPDAPDDDSHAAGLLEYPHYTRPPEFRGWAVPDVLLSGDHARVECWRREQSLRRTFLRRPDLLLKLDLAEAERRYLSRLAEELTRGG